MSLLVALLVYLASDLSAFSVVFTEMFLIMVADDLCGMLSVKILLAYDAESFVPRYSIEICPMIALVVILIVVVDDLSIVSSVKILQVYVAESSVPTYSIEFQCIFRF